MSIADAKSRLEQVVISPDSTIAVAARCLDDAGTGALILGSGPDKRLYGLLTDGDIRRCFLKGIGFETACAEIATRNPIVVSPNTPAEEMLETMNQYDIHHLPIVDAESHVMGLVLRSDLRAPGALPVAAVIMAGGFGTRLLPITKDTPKPMLLIGDRPLLQRTIERLRNAGVSRVHITTHHLADKIKNHFGNGEAYGMELKYVSEDQPLGTAGSLKLIRDLDQPILVINGDVLTDVGFKNILAYHRELRADATVGVRRYEMQVPYGVVECQGPYVRDLREKPVCRFLVNAGIYMLQPSVFRFIPNAERFDMTDLIACLLAAGRPVVTFPIVEYWRDIGKHEDYERAQEDCRNGYVA